MPSSPGKPRVTARRCLPGCSEHTVALASVAALVGLAIVCPHAGPASYRGGMHRPPTWPVAAGSLALGFAVAEATGVRPLGGLVLVAGAGWCALRWRERAGDGAAAALVVLYLAAFVASHLIAGTVGTWGAVALVSALVGVAAWALADRRTSGARATMSV